MSDCLGTKRPNLSTKMIGISSMNTYDKRFKRSKPSKTAINWCILTIPLTSDPMAKMIFFV